MAKFGILLDSKHTTYTKATSAKQLVSTYIRKTLESLEGIKIDPKQLIPALQKFVNEYGECIVENQFNDYGRVDYPIVSADEVASHLMHQGWITENSKSIDNLLQSQMILEWMNKAGIQDYDGTSFAKEMLDRENEREDKEVAALEEALFSSSTGAPENK